MSKDMAAQDPARQATLPRRTLLPGVIYFDHRKRSANCVIRELSAEGATLICETADVVPTNSFELYIVNRREYKNAVVEDRSSNQIRVTFGETESVHEPMGRSNDARDVFRRLDELERVVKRLQQTVHELKNSSNGQLTPIS